MVSRRDKAWDRQVIVWVNFFPLIPVDGLKIKMFKKAKKYQQNYDFTPVF